MTIISKSAGILSLVSAVVDTHKTALIYSKNAYSQSSADTFISSSIGGQKLNAISYKDAERKNWLTSNNFLGSISESVGSIKGYMKGLSIGIARYIPNFILSALAIALPKKHAKIANVAAIGLAGVEIADFVTNTLDLSQKNDYLK